MGFTVRFMNWRERIYIGAGSVVFTCFFFKDIWFEGVFVMALSYSISMLLSLLVFEDWLNKHAIIELYDN